MNVKNNKTFFNFLQRMFLLCIGSVITILTLNSDYKYHLAAKLIFLFFLILMAIEIHYMFDSSFRPSSVIFSILATILLPLWSFLQSYIIITHDYLPVFVISSIPFLVVLFCMRKYWYKILKEVQSILFFLVYPGLLASYFFQIPQLENATLHLYAFVGAVFVTDGFAYLVGISLGKYETKRRTRHLIEFSPGKTITGYIGGLIFCYISFAIIYIINSKMYDHSIPKLLLFSSIVSISVFLGDLFESAIKRICKVKDSGTLMLGRGGVLDTFDSMIFAAPVYLILYNIMFA